MIVLNEAAEQLYLENKIKHVECWNHGFSAMEHKSKDIKDIIFIPTNKNISMKFNSTIIRNPLFINFLDLKNLHIIQNGYNACNLENITYKEYFSDEEYAENLLTSRFIILPYTKDSFQYRVSGLLLECIANQKIVFFYKDNFKEYSKYFNYNPTFNNVSDLINLIESNWNLKNPFKNTEKLGFKFKNK
jgi:hypothetical protein